MEQKKMSTLKKVLLIIAAILVVIIVGFAVAGKIIYDKVTNDPEFLEFVEKQQKLGDEIVYYVDADKLYVHISDPGSFDWASVEEHNTENTDDETADFDGYHFTVSAAHDEGSGYFVIKKFPEDSGQAVQYAVFTIEMKEHKITEVTDAELADDLNSYDFK